MYTDDNYEIPSAEDHGTENTPSEISFSDITKKKSRKGFSIIVLSLSVALLGGAFGGAATGYFLGQKTADAQITSSFTAAAPDTSVKYASSLANTSGNTINSVYETYKSAVVGVKNEGTSTNVFGQASPSASSGTGFIISSDGYILTNNHVVEGADKVTVALYNEESYPATVIGADSENDVALLKIDAFDLNTVKLGNSDNLVVGETIFAIGNPLGELTYTVTAGIVSAENREINENGIPISMFQTDVAINPGNSGGPVFNLNGEVVGIATAKYASSNIEGIGFAIPINDAINVANQLKETGRVTGRPYLGVSVTDLNGQLTNNSNQLEGVYVATVDPNGSAANAGIQQGDIITSIDGKEIKSTAGLISTLKGFKAGNTIKVSFDRDGKNITLTVTLGENKPNI